MALHRTQFLGQEAGAHGLPQARDLRSDAGLLCQLCRPTGNGSSSAVNVLQLVALRGQLRSAQHDALFRFVVSTYYLLKGSKGTENAPSGLRPGNNM